MLLTIKTTHPRANDLISLLWNWHLHKRETTLFRRLGMHSLEIAGLSIAMLIIPLAMHRAVQGFDEMYDILGRRAKSPYAQLSWVNITFAFVMLVGWHLWLGRLTYLTVLESSADEEKDEERKDETTALSSSAERSNNGSAKGEISWSRILGRILIPLLLATLGLHFGYQVCRQSIADTRPLITRNDVDMQEAMGQLYGLV